MVSALRYECRRISSVRSTWILGVSAVAVALAILLLIRFVVGEAINSDAESTGQAVVSLGYSLYILGGLGNPITWVFIGVLVGTISAQAFGQEYRFGTIRITLTAFPNRMQIGFAKLIIIIATTVAITVVCLIAAVAIAASDPATAQSDEPVGEIVGAIAVVFAAYLGFALIIFGLTMVMRNMPLAIIIPTLLAVVVEPLIVQLIGSRVSWLPDVLPMTAGTAMLAGADGAGPAIVFGTWTLAALVVGFALFQRRDA